MNFGEMMIDELLTKSGETTTSGAGAKGVMLKTTATLPQIPKKYFQALHSLELPNSRNEGPISKEKEGIQTCEVSSTSLYIRQNFSLYEQLTKTDMKELSLPSSPIEKRSLKERWTLFPSPLPEALDAALIRKDPPQPINPFRRSILTAHNIIKEENNRLNYGISNLSKISQDIILLNERLEALNKLGAAMQFKQDRQDSVPTEELMTKTISSLYKGESTI